MWLYACEVSEAYALALDEASGSEVRWTRYMVWFGPDTGGFASMVTDASVGDDRRLLPLSLPNGGWESTRPDAGGQPAAGPYDDLPLPEDQRGLSPDWVHLRAPADQRAAAPEAQAAADLAQAHLEQGLREEMDPFEDLMRGFQADVDRRLRADVPLLFSGEELVAGLAQPFAGEGGDGWEGLAREVGLDVGRDDFREALRSLAELAWDVGFDGRESAAVDVSWMKLLRVLIDVGFEDGRQGAAFYDRTLDDLWELVADLEESVDHVTGQREKKRPEGLPDSEVRRWIMRMDVVLHLGEVHAAGDNSRLPLTTLVGGRGGLPVIGLARQLYGAKPDMEALDDLRWLAGQLDPVSSNISRVSLDRMMAGFDGRADMNVSGSEVRELVGLAGRTRKVLGRLGSVQTGAGAGAGAGADGGQRVSPVQALEAMWNADQPWQRARGRLNALARTMRDEQTVEWARGLMARLEEARSVVLEEPTESQARLNAVVLTSVVERIAERFEGDWSELAAEVGLGDGTELSADSKESLLNLAELYWEIDPDLSRFDKAPLWMRRIRLLIDAGFEDGKVGAAFYQRTMGELRSLVAVAYGPVFNSETGQRELRSPGDMRLDEIRPWLERMDVVHDVGGYDEFVGEVGADLVGGRRLFRVIRLAVELYGKQPGLEMLRGLGWWAANQLEAEPSTMSLWSSLINMVAGFEGLSIENIDEPKVRDLVSLVGRAREHLGQVDGDPKNALEAMWNADKPWQQAKDRLNALVRTAVDKDVVPMAEWARGLMARLEEARSVVLEEPAKSQASLNAVVLPPVVERIAAARFEGDWSKLAAEVGLSDGTELPADARQSLLNLAGLYWEIDPDLSRFEDAPRWMRRIRVLIDAGFEDGKEGAAFYKRTMGELGSLVAVAYGPVFNPETGQQEPQPPGEVGLVEIRLWLEQMDVVHDVGGYHEFVGAVGADLVGGRRLMPVMRLAVELYGEQPGLEMLRGLGWWAANQLDVEPSTMSLWSSLTDMIAGFEALPREHVDVLDVRDLVSLVGRAREHLGQVDGDPKNALEAMWNADKPWQQVRDRLAALVRTAVDKDDVPMAEWARGLMARLEEARSVVVREPAKSQASLNAVVLPPVVERIAERFEGDWSKLAAEVGLGDGTGLPADFEQSLLNLAELYWEIDPHLSRFDKAPLWMRRIRVLIDAGFEDGKEGADFYARTFDDLQNLLADLWLPVFNPSTGQDDARPSIGFKTFRRWLKRMDLVHDLGGVDKIAGEVGADLVGGGRLFPVVRLAEKLHDETADMEMFHGLAWLANQLDPVSSNISLEYLTNVFAGFEGQAGDHSLSEVYHLALLAGRAQEFLGQVDGDWKGALEAIWKADRLWERKENWLKEIEDNAIEEGDEQTAQWAMGRLFDFADARAVEVREPAESQARLNAVVLTPVVERIAERFEGGWGELAAEVGLGDGAELPADAWQSLLNLTDLYGEIDPDLSRFDEAPLWMRRIRVLIDAGFDDGTEGAASYARTIDDLRSLVADLPRVDRQTGQDEPRSPGTVGGWEIRRWLGRMDALAEHSYGERSGIEKLRHLARQLRVAEVRESLQQAESRQAVLAASLQQAESRQAELAALSARNAGEGVELGLRERIGALRAEIEELAGRIEAEQRVLEGLVSDAPQESGQDDAVERMAED
ncbi:hypothetical protein [Saccharopolyspora sp. ASAGF58]|uniref:hypothetical protein n=1 Tax=Saccharopolyspora sp. ASAGF58 TaxID=2719023 RepID=UPI001B314A76|nr:hypothetical protein [Saccharopolyspora sp. ASAGF58]